MTTLLFSIHLPQKSPEIIIIKCQFDKLIHNWWKERQNDNRQLKLSEPIIKYILFSLLTNQNNFSVNYETKILSVFHPSPHPLLCDFQNFPSFILLATPPLWVWKQVFSKLILFQLAITIASINDSHGLYSFQIWLERIPPEPVACKITLRQLNPNSTKAIVLMSSKSSVRSSD